jgi:hypothetical protein
MRDDLFAISNRILFTVPVKTRIEETARVGIKPASAIVERIFQ